MAARENQGLQFALIVFVILTVTLAVTTYWFFASSREAQDKTKALTSDNDNKTKQAQQAAAESEQFKSMIGAATTDKVETVQENTKKDLEKYGKSVPAGEQNYRYLVKSLATERDAAHKSIVELTAERDKLAEKIKSDEAAKATEIAEYKSKADAAASDLEAERKKFAKQLTDVESTKKDLARKFDDKRKEHEDLSKTSNEEIAGLSTDKKKLEQLIKIRNEEEERKRKANEIPDGKITWVNQRSRSVWINLGTADGLKQQTSFMVVSSEESNPAEAPSKGKLQVIRLIDRHLAEARIVEDNLSDPLMPGDNIFSATWEPGRAEHFALAGKFDIDSDGVSDRQQIHDVIALNGGVIDSELDEKGKKTGEMSINTKYLIVGDQPRIGPETKDVDLTGWNAIIGEAQVLGVKTIPVKEFLKYMGHKIEDRTVNLGRRANPKDFVPRLPAGVQRTRPSDVRKGNRPALPAPSETP